MGWLLCIFASLHSCILGTCLCYIFLAFTLCVFSLSCLVRCTCLYYLSLSLSLALSLSSAPPPLLSVCVSFFIIPNSHLPYHCRGSIPCGAPTLPLQGTIATFTPGLHGDCNASHSNSNSEAWRDRIPIHAMLPRASTSCRTPQGPRHAGGVHHLRRRCRSLSA